MFACLFEVWSLWCCCLLCVVWCMLFVRALVAGCCLMVVVCCVCLLRVVRCVVCVCCFERVLVFFCVLFVLRLLRWLLVDAFCPCVLSV